MRKYLVFRYLPKPDKKILAKDIIDAAWGHVRIAIASL